MALNPRQTAFVREFLKDSHATNAAIRAGYSKKTAYAIGSRLLKQVEIQQAISTKAVKVAEKAEVSVERVLKEYARIAFLNPQDFYDDDGNLRSIKDMPEDAARAIAGLDEEQLFERDEYGNRLEIGRLKKIRLIGKVPALEGLARHLGMFQDLNVGVAQAFQINIHIGAPSDGE
jgi:phage terminase small subunit